MDEPLEFVWTLLDSLRQLDWEAMDKLLSSRLELTDFTVAFIRDADPYMEVRFDDGMKFVREALPRLEAKNLLTVCKFNAYIPVMDSC